MNRVTHNIQSEVNNNGMDKSDGEREGVDNRQQMALKPRGRMEKKLIDIYCNHRLTEKVN